MIETLDCLICGGEKRQLYLCENRFIECAPCGGTGKVRRDAAWVESGRSLRRIRMDRGLSLGDLARAYGCSVVDVSDAERARTDPSCLLSFVSGQSARLGCPDDGAPPPRPRP